MTDKRKKLTDAQVTQLQDLYKARVPGAQIARFFNVSRATVRHHTGGGHMPVLPIHAIIERLAA